jgi:CRISPR-associated protein Cas2
MGHCLVVYDITHDRTRTKVAEICLDYGLDRIQYSAFLGTLVRTHQEELMQKLERQLGQRSGSIQLYPICRKDWERRVAIEVKGKTQDGRTGDRAKNNRSGDDSGDSVVDSEAAGPDSSEEELPPF